MTIGGYNQIHVYIKDISVYNSSILTLDIMRREMFGDLMLAKIKKRNPPWFPRESRRAQNDRALEFIKESCDVRVKLVGESDELKLVLNEEIFE